MRSVAQVLHNIADHVLALRAILERNEATGDFRARLLKHILDEEVDNRRFLGAAAGTASQEEKRTIELALDHSLFVCDIARGEEVSPGLAKSLLEHFQEEYEQGFLDEPAPPAGPPRPGWTVGSLLGGPKP
ncbi:MAG: hypothetical protein HYY17_15795 [Planctomycetes bacterium]|nr:hypothetical protein [Planctomycetota bacterium]